MKREKILSDINLLAVSTGLIYLWFGALKFLPNLSPAEELATNTVDIISFGLIPPSKSIILLAIWEVVVGISLIISWRRKQAAVLGLIHIFFTFFPLVLFYQDSFTNPPLGFSLLGQYIFKNVLIAAALFIIYRRTKAVKA